MKKGEGRQKIDIGRVEENREERTENRHKGWREGKRKYGLETEEKSRLEEERGRKGKGKVGERQEVSGEGKWSRGRWKKRK